MARNNELIRLAKKAAGTWRNTHEYQQAAQIIDMLVDELEKSTLTQPNEWVSVEERLPEPDFPRQQRGFYLVALSNGTVKELMYEFRHYENMMFDVGWHETAFPVTHWMLLPAPPKKEE